MFKIKLTLNLVLVSFLYFAACSASESKSKQSMMEYMNEFFKLDNADSEFKIHEKANSDNLGKNHYRFSQQNNTATPAAPAATNATAPAGNNSATPSQPTEEELQKLVLEDWLMISSQLFDDPQIFPPIFLPDGRRARIRTDQAKFRLNDAFFAPSGTKPPSSREFWFRLSGLNLYYSLKKEDVNILGAIAIEQITNAHMGKSQIYVANNETYCFTVYDQNHHDWKICSRTEENSKKWVCGIKKMLGDSPAYCVADKNVTIQVVEKSITQPIIIIPLPSKFCNENWNYQKMGSDWECDCQEGKEQSPIDLPAKDKAIDSPVKPFFQYDRVVTKSPVQTIEGYQGKDKDIHFQYLEGALKLIYHKIGKIVTLDGAIYFGQEIVFHTPAEHTVNGKNFEMEIQVVHYGQSVGDIAKQVSLSFLVEKAPGVYNQFIDDFEIFDLPNPTDTQKKLKHEIYLPKIFFEKKDEDEAIAHWKPFSFYTYQGSLSFPPCTENTIVYVASKPIKLGTTALALFEEALRIPDMQNSSTGDVVISDWNTLSARKVQPLNGRPVFYYDHEKYCGPEREEAKPIQEGHYEKVANTITKYFYVSKNKPSGVPNSYVVSKEEADGTPETKKSDNTNS
jgi:carbonic anhydrase